MCSNKQQRYFIGKKTKNKKNLSRNNTTNSYVKCVSVITVIWYKRFFLFLRLEFPNGSVALVLNWCNFAFPKNAGGKKKRVSFQGKKWQPHRCFLALFIWTKVLKYINKELLNINVFAYFLRSGQDVGVMTTDCQQMAVPVLLYQSQRNMNINIMSALSLM